MSGRAKVYVIIRSSKVGSVLSLLLSAEAQRDGCGSSLRRASGPVAAEIMIGPKWS